MAQLADLLKALERIGDQPGRPVSAHLDPALNEAAKIAVALGLSESVSALTGAALHAELRRLALRTALDDYYARRPADRPSAAEIALFLASVRKLAVAGHPDLPTVLHSMTDALGANVDPETLLAATVGHLAISGSAA
jgi:hypothetical protein